VEKGDPPKQIGRPGRTPSPGQHRSTNASIIKRGRVPGDISAAYDEEIARMTDNLTEIKSHTILKERK
jgi:hypothetical protein